MPLRTLNTIRPQPVHWLWPYHLPLGKLVILDGDPGLGKSLLSLDLAARLSTGRPFPNEPEPAPIATSIIASPEDGDADTIRPRMDSLGAKLEHIHFLEAKTEKEFLRLPSRIRILQSALSRSHAKLVVLDPFTAFLDNSVIDGSDRAIRAALRPLSRLAAHHNCAVLLIRHLNKTGSAQPLYRGLGSIGLLGVCRAAWLVARDPDQVGRRILAMVKNNLAPPQPSLAFEILNDAGGLKISWLGTSSLSAFDILTASRAAPDTSLRRAQDFLSDILRNGALTTEEIWKAAAKGRHAQRTLYRARLSLKIRAEEVTLDGRRLTYWLLENQKLPDTIPEESRPPDLEPWLAPLRQRYPPKTPLDDP